MGAKQTLKMLIRFSLLVVITGVALHATTADAKTKKRPQRIELTGVQSFDKVFRKARDMDAELKGAERNLRKSKQSFRKALNLGKTATYLEGLQELKVRAKAKLTVVMQGGIPTLKAKDAVPSDVKAGVDAVNALSKSIPATLRNLKEVSEASSAMYKRAKNFPNNIQSELASGGADGLIAIVTRAPKIAKTTMGNLKVIGSMPKRASVVSEDLGELTTAIRKTFM